MSECFRRADEATAETNDALNPGAPVVVDYWTYFATYLAAGGVAFRLQFRDASGRGDFGI